MSNLLSVLVAVYNGEQYIKECIESIINQTFTDLEIIVIDDASTDNTASIVKSIKDERIFIYTNEKNSGPFVSANTGLALAKGKYIARLDADDVSHRDRFEKQIEFLEKTGYELVGSNLQIIDENGKKTNQIINPETHEENVGNILFANSIAHSSVMFSRDFVNKIGGYSTEFNKAQDYDLWLKIIAAGGRVYNLQDFLIDYRVHSQSITSMFRSKQEEIARHIIKKYIKLFFNINLSERQIDILRNKVDNLNFAERIITVRFLIKLNSAFIKKFPQYELAHKMFYSNCASLLKDSRSKKYFVNKYAKSF